MKLVEEKTENLGMNDPNRKIEPEKRITDLKTNSIPSKRFNFIKRYVFCFKIMLKLRVKF